MASQVLHTDSIGEKTFHFTLYQIVTDVKDPNVKIYLPINGEMEIELLEELKQLFGS